MFYVIVTIVALLPQCVSNPLINGISRLLQLRKRGGNEVGTSGCNSNGSKVSACLQKGACSGLVNLRQRISSYLSRHPILQMVLPMVMAILLLIYGVASIVTGSICVYSQSSSPSSGSSSNENQKNQNNAACAPASEMDIVSGIIGIIMGIKLLLSGYSASANDSSAADTAAVVERGEASPMLGDQPSPVGDESPGDQPSPVGDDGNSKEQSSAE